jgi:hypothetical protein
LVLNSLTFYSTILCLQWILSIYVSAQIFLSFIPRKFNF